MTAPWMDVAKKYLGVKEIAGKKHNPVIVEFFAAAGHPGIKDDETAWCSAFLNAVMFEAGYTGTRNLMARSWLTWAHGDKVSVPTYGDVAIFKRGSSPIYGHVAFFERWDNQWVYVLGGNQSDAVTRTKISRDQLLGFRRPREGGEPKVPEMTQVDPPVTKDVGVAIGGGAAAVTAVSGLDPILAAAAILIIAAGIGYFIWKKRSY